MSRHKLVYRSLIQVLADKLCKAAKSLFAFFLVLFSVLTLASVAMAETILIREAKIVTAGESDRIADVLIDEGAISRINESIPLSSDMQVIEANGKVLTAGFFNANTQLGLREVGSVKDTVDSSSDNQRVTASLRVSDAINPSSVLIPYNRSLGITQALVVPSASSGIFSGTASVIQLSDNGTTQKSDAAMILHLGIQGKNKAGGSRAATMALLREALEDARDYQLNKSRFNQGQRREYALSRHDLAALEPVVSGEMPLIVYVDRAIDIKRMIDFSKAQKLRLILASVEEAWRVADYIADNKVPVIIDPIFNLPANYDTLGSRLDNAKILHDAGVTLLFTGMSWHSTHNAHLVRQSAGNAIANGLPYDAALAAVTVNPAQVFGLNSGSIKQGYKANLVLWNGDPFEPATQVEAVIIGGKRYAMVNRSTRLRDRYLKRLKAKMLAE